MGLVHDHALDRPQAIIEGRAWIVVGAAGGDRIDRLTTGRARTHHLEEMTLIPALDIQVREEQVLVDPARHQVLARTRCIEETLPRLHLAEFGSRWRNGLLLYRSALLQPLAQGGVFAIGQPGHGERHAAVRVLAGVLGELPRQRAGVAAGDGNIQILRQLGVGR